MTRSLSVPTLLLLALAMVTTEASAQRRGLVDVSPTSVRHGFWLEAGGGWGQEAYKFGSDPYSSNLGKPTFDFRIGGTLNPYFRLGAEVTSWWNSYQNSDGFDVTESLTHLMAIGRVYPVKDLGLFAKGGAGIAWTGASVDYGNATTESGFATVLGAGYEVQLSKKLFLTPAFDWYMSSYQKRDDATLHERLLNFSLSLTWQPGH